MPHIDEQARPDVFTFRRTMGLFATGVSVMATWDADGSPVGMTANALTSLSLDPMLLLVCVGKSAKIAAHLFESPGFSISLLTEDQEDLSNFFARIWPEQAPPPPFEFEEWDGQPRLSGCLGAVACRTQDILEGGDHWIVIGEVTSLYRPLYPGKPLIFYNGLYRSLSKLES